MPAMPPRLPAPSRSTHAPACASGMPVPASDASPAASGNPFPVLDSADILRGQKTIAIHHNGATYRLQATRLGKLILTK